MKVSREQRAEHRRRILDAAGRLFRSKGFDAVTVAEVMHAGVPSLFDWASGAGGTYTPA